MDGRLTHIFSVELKKEADSKQTRDFLRKTAKMLPKIPGVENFRIYKKQKGGNEYIIYMEFEDVKTYEKYNSHPLHREYVTDVWSKVAGQIEVIDLKEIKTECLMAEGEYDG